MKQRAKEFEREIHDFLKTYVARDLAVVHRFYDSHSAGDYLPGQPGDFLVIVQGTPILLEAKSSEVHASFRSCFSDVPAGQIGHHILWSRALVKCWFVFLTCNNTYEVWRSADCIKARGDGRPLKLSSRFGVFDDINTTLHTIIDYSLL